MAKIMVQYGSPSRSSWKEFIRSSFGRTIVGKAIWENPIETWMGEIPNWECLFVHREKGLFLSVYVDDIKLAGKTKSWSDVKTAQQRRRFVRTNIFPRSCILGLHSTTMWHKQRYCGQLQNHVRIANFSGGSRDIAILSKSSRLSMVLWHGWPCKEMCGTILWVGEQDDSATLQSIYSMHRWPPFQRIRNEIFWRNVTYLFSNCSEMLIWHELEDLIFYGQ